MAIARLGEAQSPEADKKNTVAVSGAIVCTVGA